MEEGAADVDGDDGFGAVLEEAVGEAAGGGADVDAAGAVDAEVEAVEGFLEFEAAAGDEGFGVADAEGGVGGDEVAGFGGGGVVDEDFAGEDEALGLFAGFDEAGGDEEEVEADFFGFRGGGQGVRSGGRVGGGSGGRRTVGRRRR